MRHKRQAAGRPGERRLDSRVQEEDKVVLELLTNGAPPSDKTLLNALSRDVSPGGTKLMTNTLLPVGTLLKLEIALSRRRRLVRAMGVVRWARSISEEEWFEIGVEFTHISPEDKMLLLEHTYKRR